MAQKTLDAVIRLMGQTMPSFVQLGDRITALGDRIEGVGSKVREFEKESVEVYRNYEDNMLGVQRVFAGKIDSPTQLQKIIEDLDNYASEWAASTIFHTDDVSAAILKAAQAGFSYVEIVNAIPQAMHIAQAGNLELTSGFDYLATIMRSTGSEYGYLADIVDQWAMAADSSKTNIDEMGQAFTALGASAQFGDSTAELFTMLAVLADVGTTGTRAGTALRGAMMRIIAPTTKAENAMSLLGADADELNDVLSDENVTKAAKKLEGLGFSAYDAQGNLLPMLDIFTNLHTALQGLDEQAQNEILAAIFPTRNIATAKAFMEAVGNGKMADLFEQIGDSEGYAAQGADIMMSGLTGSIETLKSKWEEFERQVGKTLAPAIEDVAGWLGQIVDGLNDMDPTMLNALVGGLTGLALVGPGLKITGAAIAFFGGLGPVGGTMLALSVGAFALYTSLKHLSDTSFKGNFGDMQLDLDELGKHVSGLQTQFTSQMDAIGEWEKALENAESQYAEKSTRLSETMLTDVLTGKKLTAPEKKNLFDYADELYTNVLLGLRTAKSSDMSFLDAIFGDFETPEQMDVGNTAAQVVNSWYGDLETEAYAIGQKIRNQMTAALQDSELDEAERQAIQASIDRYNQIMAEIQSQMDSEAYYAQVRKGQRVSWDTISEYMAENAEKQEADMAAVQDAYDAKWAHYRAAYEHAIANHEQFTDLNGVSKYVEEGDWEKFEAQFEQEYAQALQSVRDKYGNLNTLAFDALMNDSDFTQAWSFLKYTHQVGVGPENLVNETAGNTNFAAVGVTPENAGTLADQLYELFRDKGRMMDVLEPFEGYGDIATFMSMLTGSRNMADALNEYLYRNTKYTEEGTDTYNEFSTPEGRALARAQENLAALQERQSEISADIARRETNLAERADYKDWWYTFTNGPQTDYAALHGGTYGGGLYAEQEQVNLDIAAAEAEVARLQGEVDALGGDKTVSVTATLNSSAVDNWTPPTKFMTVYPRAEYAEGGRATEPSIFGEAGAEWAIPEQHTERTAWLLNKAREASGFSWGDLIGRFGGLNANPNHQNVTVNYSPTINAQDATGVAEILKADKARLLKMVREMLAEQRLRDEVEVYA